MVVAGGWWVLVVVLWPSASRPYIGGAQTDSVLELTLGYNGLGRLTGDEVGSVGGGGGWGETGPFRLLDSEIGGQVRGSCRPRSSPSAPVSGFTRRAPRTDLVRAGLVLWGGWLVVTALTFSFMAGIFHAYYTVALAPAIAALVAVGGLVLWRHRSSYAASLTLAATVSLTTAFGIVLLRRTDYLPWLPWVVALLGFTSALLLAALPHLSRVMASVVAGTALVAVLLAPATYSLAAAATPHTGSIPSAGPSGAGLPGGASAPGGPMGGAMPGVAGGFGGVGGAPGGTTGGLLTGNEPTAAVTDLLRADAQNYTWAAAVVGANSAAGYQLASELPVMAVGGFNGSDPSPTLAEFQQHVADGEIHWFVSGGQGRGGMSPGGSTSSEIVSWVAAEFTATTVDGVTMYDLTGGVR